MWKKWAIGLLSLCAVWNLAVMDVKAAQSGDYEYSVQDDGTAKITGYKGAAANITIPESLDGYKVTRIDGDAFYNNDIISTVVMPDSITVVEDFSFSLCDNLRSVVFSDNVTTIAKQTFAYCPSLSDVDFPKSLTVIDDHAFSSCNSLSSIVIPQGVTSLGPSAFSNCENLASIKLPVGITEIKEWTFYNCVSLTSIKIPAGVTSIGQYAFSSCASLSSVSIPKGVKSIGNDAFEFCDGLTSIYIPDGVTTIGDWAFAFSDNLDRVGLPASVVSVGEKAFYQGIHNADFYYTGSAQQWNNIVFAGDSSYLASAVKHCNSVYTEVSLQLRDLSTADWFYPAVEYVYANGLMTGMDPITFGPYSSLSRAQFATILYRMNNSPAIQYRPIFGDVGEGDWYAKAVLWAYENGIVTGYQSGNFGPADMITREQMAVMMFRYANYLNQDTSVKANFSGFSDAAGVSPFAAEAMQWAVGNGIITGKSGGTILDPQGNTARAEAAVIIQRFLG